MFMFRSMHGSMGLGRDPGLDADLDHILDLDVHPVDDFPEVADPGRGDYVAPLDHARGHELEIADPDHLAALVWRKVVNHLAKVNERVRGLGSYLGYALLAPTAPMKRGRP